MPIPEPSGTETESEFMQRCIAFVRDEGRSQEQAVAICTRQWEETRSMAQSQIEFKTFKADDIESDAEGRTIVGHAAVFGNQDQVGDIIEPGAFAKTLTERGDRVKVGYNHSVLIGRPLKMFEDDKGLYTESRISRTRQGDDVLTLVRDRVIDEMSIGYRVIKADKDEDGVRHLKEIALYEYGPVDMAANEEAVISGVKSLAYKLEHGQVDEVALDEIREQLTILSTAIERYKAAQPERSTAPEPSGTLDTQITSLGSEFTGILSDAIKQHRIRSYVYG